MHYHYINLVFEKAPNNFWSWRVLVDGAVWKDGLSRNHTDALAEFNSAVDEAQRMLGVMWL